MKVNPILYFLILMISSVVMSQERASQTDSLQINDSIKGVSEYEYYITNGEKKWDGKFVFESISKASTSQFDFEVIGYKGQFEDDKKSGDWVFYKRQIKEIPQKFVSDFKIGNLANGSENKIEAQFLDGKAVGFWRATEVSFVNSEIEDTIFNVESSFKDNQLAGAFRATSAEMEVRGYFNAEGYFHGEWELIHKGNNTNITEFRQYDAGVIQDYTVEIGNASFSVPLKAIDTNISNDEQWIDVSSQDYYFEILNLVCIAQDESHLDSNYKRFLQAQKQSNDFLKYGIKALAFNSGFNTWQTIKGSDNVGLGQFKVRKYPFSSEEIQNIEQIQTRFTTLNSMLNDFLQNPNIKIGKPAYEVFNKVELIYQVYKDALDELKPMVDIIESSAFEYVERPHIYSQLRPQINFPVEVSYVFQDKRITKPHDFPDIPGPENFNLKTANEFMARIISDLKHTQVEVDEILKSMQIEKSLSRDEERLIQLKAKIESLFKNENDQKPTNAYHKRYAEDILSLTEQSFNAYSNLRLDEKKTAIKSRLKCFEGLIDFHQLLSNLKLKDKRLDDAYTNTTFNPFIMTDMSERIKDRLYNAFYDYLQPYLLDKLEAEFSCQSVDMAMEEITAAYSKMLELSKTDTREEEKALRRERDPKQIMEVLNLEFKY